MAVNFSDTSTGSVTAWSWDFGDTVTSALQNPSHTYTGVGTYTVSLTVTGPGGSDTLSMPNYIRPADATPPAAPTGLAATAGDGSVDLDWNDNTDPDLASYSVKRATTTGGPYTPIASGVAVSAYTDNTATNGTTYFYVVSAVDTGSNESSNSTEALATPADATPPAAPTGLAATAGDGSVDLDWADNTDPDLASYSVKQARMRAIRRIADGRRSPG